MPLLVHDIPAATAVLYAVGASAFAAEALATHIGTAPEATSLRGRLRALRTSVTTVAFTRKQGSARTLDRGTKRILLLGVWAALAVEWVSAAALPGLRAGANTWPTLIAGALLAMSGIALRAGSVWTLGRFFQREIIIEDGQSIVRDGPYRRLRHPAYAGTLLTLFGLGVAMGSWIGACVGTVLAGLAHLPRIRAEERTLATAFPAAYPGYAGETARLVPRVW